MLERFKTLAYAIQNAILGVNLISLTQILTPRAFIRSVSSQVFTFKAVNRKRGLPEQNPFRVLPNNGRLDITLGNLHAKTFLWSDASRAMDIIALCEICRLVNPKVVFEIGTLHGYTALHFALNSCAEAKIFSLDLPRGQQDGPLLRTTLSDQPLIKSSLRMENGYCFSGTDVEHKIDCLFGDSAKFDFSKFYNQVELFFVDGAHSYEYVASDTDRALRCVKNGGVIVWHDFGRVGNYRDVSRFLVKMAHSGYPIYAVPGTSVAYMQVKTHTLAQAA